MTPAAGEVRKAVEMQLTDTYIDYRKGAVDQWVADTLSSKYAQGRRVIRGGGGGRIMVATVGAIKSAHGNLVEYLVGGHDKSEWEIYTVGYGSRDIGGRQMGGWRC